MALQVKIHGGIRKARRALSQLGLDVRSCKPMGQSWARETDFRTKTGRKSVCSVADTDEANRIVRREFQRSASKIFGFKNK